MAALLALAGCDGQGGDASPFSLEDSLGVAVATNRGPSWASGEEWRVPVQPRVRLGGEDPGAATGDEVEAARPLHDVAGATRLTDGRIAVLNAGTAEVLVFSPSGEVIAAWGGEGDGPGELRAPGNLVRGPGDTIRVWDHPFRGVTVFGPDGGFVDAPGRVAVERVLAAFGGAQPLPPFLLPGGDLLTRQGSIVVRFSPSAERFDTLAVLPDPGSSLLFPATVSLAWSAEAPAHAFVAHGRTPEVRVYTPDGTLARIVRTSLEPAPVPPEAVQARIAEIRESSDLPPSVLESLLEEAEAPDVHPVIDDVLVGRDGHLWVRPRDPEGPRRARYLVYTPEGRELGPVELPLDARLLEADSSHLLALHEDELGVETVLLYDLER